MILKHIKKMYFYLKMLIGRSYWCILFERIYLQFYQTSLQKHYFKPFFGMCLSRRVCVCVCIRWLLRRHPVFFFSISLLLSYIFVIGSFMRACFLHTDAFIIQKCIFFTENVYSHRMVVHHIQSEKDGANERKKEIEREREIETFVQTFETRMGT